MQLTESLLNTYLGKHIDQICPVRYVAPNHCAHFVSHVLQMNFGLTCGAAANVRVQEIFNRCPWIREVNTCPPQDSNCLIFVTDVRNVALNRPGAATPSGASLVNVPKKHIGILLAGQVWHYSNSAHQVRRESASQFLYHYPRQTNGLWVGGLPSGASATPFGTCSR